MSKNALTLILLFLFIPLLIKSISFFQGQWVYLADEAIVGDISTQNIEDIAQILPAEPHPPGFYFFLKLFPDPFKHPITFKIALSVFNFFVWVGIITWFQKNKILSVTVFYFFAIILSTYSVILVNSTAKQDLISLPFFIFFLSNIYLYATTTKGKFLNLSIFSLTILLFFSYLYYLIGAIATLLTLTSVKPWSKQSFLLLGVHLLLSGIVLRYFAYTQFLVNLERFNWLKEYSNNFLFSLIDFLSLRDLRNSLMYFQLILFLIMIVFALLSFAKKFKKGTILISVIMFCLIGVFFRANFFARPRYAMPLHLLLSFFAAYGLSVFPTSRHLKILLLTVAFLIPNLTNYHLTNNYNYQYREHVRRMGAVGQPIGLIYQNTISSFILHRGFSLDSNIVPISKEFPEVEYEGHLTYELLLNLGNEKILNEAELSSWLRSTGLTSFIYLQEQKEKERVYDKDLKVLSYLSKSCELKETIQYGPLQVILKFESCQI